MTVGLGLRLKDGSGNVHDIFIPETPSKGDLIAGSGDATQASDRLAVGSNGQVLSADDTQLLGLKWVTPTSGTVTSVWGTANQVAVATGTTTPVISLTGPHGFTTQTLHGILLGQGTSAITATAEMTDGQLLVGQTSSNPVPKALSGDATLAATGALTIANGAVSYAKLQNVSATDRVLGRATAGAGVVEEISCTALGRAVINLATLTDHGVLIGSGTAAPDATAVGTDGQLLLGQSAADPAWKSSSGDVTIDKNGVTTIGAGKVTQAMLAASVGLMPGYVYRLNLTWSSASVVIVKPGSCVDSTAGALLTLSSAVTIDYSSEDVAAGLVRKTLTGTLASTSGSATFTGSGTSFLTEFGTRALSGTISSSGTAVTGSGTKFLSEIAVNDLIGSSVKGYFRVTAIASDTALTLSTTPGSAFSATSASCIENPTINAGSNPRLCVDTITSDTSLTTTTSATTTASGITAYAGAVGSTASRFYYLHVCSGASGTTAIISTQRTTPWLPTGYTSYFRRIGSVVTDTSGNILAFSQKGTGAQKEYQWQFAFTANNSRIVSSGTATSWTAAVGSAVAPPSAVALGCGIIINANAGATTTCNLRPRNTGTSDVSRPFTARCQAGGTNSATIMVDCDGAGAIDYITSNPGNVNVDVYGFIEQL